MPTLRELREARGWTQEQLAYRLEVSRGTVSRWELGIVQPTRVHLAELAKVLGAAPAQLVGEDQ